MHKTGIALIYLSVAIRALVEQSTGSNLGLVILLLLVFGGFLFGEQALTPVWGCGVVKSRKRLQAAYLLVEMGLVIGLLLIPPTNDYPALLFIPLSLQAVMFYPQRTGFYWITLFTLVIVFILTWDVDIPIQGLAMALLFGGICYLVGSYAHMIRKAETARRENQRAFEELQVAHHQLQGYSAQRQELAAAKERVRFARELHDSVTQTVFSMNLVAQTARILWPDDLVRVDAQFVRLFELADDAMRQIQALVAYLEPQRDAVSGLIPAIEQLITERKILDGLDVTIDVQGEMDLPEEVNESLFRIVQEALTNIAKHAGTKQAAVCLNLAGNSKYIEIEDQGIGFNLDSSHTQPGHIGLSGMMERADEIGWKLSIDTQSGRGTRIRVDQDMDR